MTSAVLAPIGKVWLAGAGPGDPELLTIKTLRLIQSADVVIYDRLVAPAIMALIPPLTRRIYVGKARSNHTVPQEDINQLLVSEAGAGHQVLRLKGGDPFIFGRGGEEIEKLAEAGITFEVVPGITAASGCAAYAGIPLTHRDYAQSVRFITGHLKNDDVNLHWPELMDPMQTLVFYMGLLGLPLICKQLIGHGRDPHTPVALIEKGTTPSQRVVIATLATVAERMQKEKVQAPVLTIIGDVVCLHKKLSWY